MGNHTDNDRDGEVIALARIAAEREARTGRLDIGGLGLTRLPDALFELEWLETLILGDKYWLLRRGSISKNRIAADLDRLSCLRRLRKLDCSGTNLQDLKGIAACRGLESIDCSYTQVSNLQPLVGLAALTSLDCSATQVQDLQPLAALTALTSLDCSFTQVRDLRPLAGLATLTSLDCASTQVRDLQPLAGLTALTSLDCSGNPVQNLQPLAGLAALTLLDCSETQVQDLQPLAGLQNLQEFRCTDAPIKVLPEALSASPTLEFLSVSAGPGLASIPAEVLSQHPLENCLPRLRFRLDDVASGAEPLRDLKVLVLGNGRVGKTQLCRRLRGLPFEPDADSTHGIGVTSTELPMPEGPPALLNLWDFGGQDLYHGTHALFMRTRALFLVLWTPGSESGEHSHAGMPFRNRPLAYWLDYVRHLGGAQSPLVLIQNQCDGGRGERPGPPESPALRALADDGRLLRAFGYSARDGSGSATLTEALQQAVTALRALQGQPSMGRNSLAVRDQLRAWRDADAARADPGARVHRLLPYAEFADLCARQGVHDPASFAEVLHRAGEVWYQPGHFGDRMILDQSWALREIYALFTREDGVYAILRGPGLAGRFTRPLLDRLLWGQASTDRGPLSESDQRVLLGLMVESGICFVHRHGHGDPDATEYVAPDLLPDRAALAERLTERWEGRSGPVASADFAFPFLSPVIARTVLSDLGSEAGDRALYWRYGLSLYDAAFKAAAEIEEVPDAQGHGGRLGIRARGDDAAGLLRTLTEYIATLNDAHGWSGEARWPDGSPAPELMRVGDAAYRHAGRGPDSAAGPGAPVEASALRPALPPAVAPAMPEVFISYHWQRDIKAPLVDDLCNALAHHGQHVLRDKDELRWGDSIAEFMGRLAAGRCVILVLSADYLRSPFCMTELHGVWEAAQGREQEFRRRILPLVQEDAGIRSLSERVAHARHWADERKRLDTLLRDCAASEVIELIGATGHAELERINGFCRHLVPMLTLANDLLVPRTLSELAADDFAVVRELIGRAQA